MKTYVSIINMKNLVNLELNWTHIFRNSRRLSKLDFSTSFLIMCSKNWVFLNMTSSSDYSFSRSANCVDNGLSVEEVKPAKECAHYIPYMAESSENKWYPVNAVSIELHALNLLETHRSPSCNWKTSSTWEKLSCGLWWYLVLLTQW